MPSYSSSQQDSRSRGAKPLATGHARAAAQRGEGQPRETALLTAQLEAAIRRLTGDRVRSLRVQVQTETVIIEGRCATFYCKQLAQQAALALLCDESLVNRIEVY